MADLGEWGALLLRRNNPLSAALVCSAKRLGELAAGRSGGFGPAKWVRCVGA